MNFLSWLYQHPPLFLATIVILSLWELLWKGIALWYASRNKQKKWFVIILILNTMGLLPIIYLRWFKPKRKEFVVGQKNSTPEAATKKGKK